MKKYLDKSGNSGIELYEAGVDFIKIKFKDNASVYFYTYELNGSQNIEKMKALAISGIGLATYISKHPEIRDRFDMK